MADIPTIETIERLVVHPGEMLVLTVPPDTSDEDARHHPYHRNVCSRQEAA